MQRGEGARVLEQVSPVPEPSLAVEAETALLTELAQQIGIHAAIVDGRDQVRSKLRMAREDGPLPPRTLVGRTVGPPS